MSSACPPSLAKFARLQGCDARSETRAGTVSPGRAAVPMLWQKPCQSAFSVRARSRGPRSTLRCVCSERPHSFAFSAAAGVLVHTSSFGGKRRPLRKGGWHATQWEATAEPTRWQRGVRSRPDFSRAGVQSPSASPRRWRVFCKGTHPSKLLNEFQSERAVRCDALVAARPTGVARAARCKDSAPGGGSAVVGPAPRPRAEAR